MLKSKTAIVTGASNGIGREIALMLASEGADVVINYASDHKSAEEVLDNVQKLGSQGLLVKADLGKMEDIERLANTALEKFEKIDILVNNAGVFIDSGFLTASEEDWDRTMNVNTKGVFFLSQAVARSMVKRNIRGRIINISSVATKLLRGMPADYCVSKSAVNTLTLALSAALGEYGITVNAILPGPIPTKLNKWQFDDPVTSERLRDWTTLKEYGDTRYVAQAARYFLTDEAKWTTGSLLNVDGGAAV
jgi:NAD(P)-dependent dehydrogenase (short-subunit alcohol dehydrogenase family)